MKIAFPKVVKSSYVLRPFDVSDTKDLTDVIERNRAFLRTTLPWLDYSRSETDSSRFIEHSISGYLEETSLNLCLEGANEGIIGVVSFNKIAIEPETKLKFGTIGYWLDSSMNGKEIVTEAVRILLDIGFENYSIDRACISCGTENRKSQMVAERLGFKFIKEIKDAENLYGKYVNHFLYELGKDD